jgi:hypothetical protein
MPPPFTLHPDTRWRVHGRLGCLRTVYFGVNLRDANGAFAGRFLTALNAHVFGTGESFDVTIPLRRPHFGPRPETQVEEAPGTTFRTYRRIGFFVTRSPIRQDWNSFRSR